MNAEPSASRSPALPRWAREIDQSLTVTSQFALWGNVRDRYLVPSGSGMRFASLLDVIWEVLSASGYRTVLVYDIVDGLTVHSDTEEAKTAASEIVGWSIEEQGPGTSIDRVRGVMDAVTRTGAMRAGLVMDYASRLTDDPQVLTDQQREFFAFAQKLSHTAPPAPTNEARTAAVFNPLFWILDGEGDMPDWFLGPNDAVRAISVGLPEYGERLAAAQTLMASLEPDDGDASSNADRFAASAHGLTLLNMIGVVRLARDRDIPSGDITDAVRAYKVGVLDNPWQRPDLRERLIDGEKRIRERVFGQDAAITRTFDILKRSVMGLSGAQSPSSSAKPRGVLFFAGPTGVGKTELAKQVTELVFGDQDAYTRFDMSEFNSEHADARLIGAPPGYVGYDAGGQLTNAVRQRPFQLVLFDEIDKAHPRILDKFLQVLDDGRLTDGRGATVHFTETLIVFTSNLGIYVEDETGRRVLNVDPAEMDHRQVEERVKAAIEQHFTEGINRPELYNRLGDNIVVFDFIRPSVAERIFDLLLDNVTGRVLEELGINMQIGAEARAQLVEACTGELMYGGRGIASQLESALINPLARALFERDTPSDGRVTVTRVIRAQGWYELEIE